MMTHASAGCLVILTLLTISDQSPQHKMHSAPRNEFPRNYRSNTSIENTRVEINIPLYWSGVC